MGTVPESEWKRRARPLVDETAAIVTELYRAARAEDRSLPHAVEMALERLPVLDRALRAIPDPASVEGREVKKNLQRALKCGVDGAKGGKGHFGVGLGGRPSFIQRMLWSLTEEAQSRVIAANSFIAGPAATGDSTSSLSEPASVTFPDFFVFGMLQSMKWPRKEGLVKKKDVVDPRIVDSVISQLTELGATLGAGRPRLAT